MSETKASAPAADAKRERGLLKALLLVATLSPLYWFGEPGLRYVAWSVTGSPRREAALYRSVAPLGSMARDWLTRRVRVTLRRSRRADAASPDSPAVEAAEDALFHAIRSLSREDRAIVCGDLLNSGEARQIEYALRLLAGDDALVERLQDLLRSAARESGWKSTHSSVTLITDRSLRQQLRDVPILISLSELCRDDQLDILRLLWLGSEDPGRRESGTTLAAHAIEDPAWERVVRAWIQGLLHPDPARPPLVEPERLVLALRKLTNPKWIASRKLLIDPAPFIRPVLAAIRESLPQADGATGALLESALTPLPDAEIKPARQVVGSGESSDD